MATPWYDYPFSQKWNPPKEYGVDLSGLPLDTPITAMHNGIVTQAGRTEWYDNGNWIGSSGGLVAMEADVPGHGTHNEYYLHMDKLAPGIQPGQFVQRGQTIAFSGGQLSGGHWPVQNMPGHVYSTGRHIEIGEDAPFLKQQFGANINPIPILRQASQGLSAGSASPPTPPNSNTIQQAIQGLANSTGNIGSQVANTLTSIYNDVTSTQTGIQSITQTSLHDLTMLFVGLGAAALLVAGLIVLGNTPEVS